MILEAPTYGENQRTNEKTNESFAEKQKSYREKVLGWFNKFSTENIWKGLEQAFKNNAQLETIFRNIIGDKLKAKFGNTENSKENYSNIQELSLVQIEEGIRIGEEEIKKVEEENRKIEQKIIKIQLIREVSGMYKEYLQSVLDDIGGKWLSQKDERYEAQIGTMKNKMEYLENLVKHLETLENYDELKNLNLETLLNEVIVPEAILSENGFFFQPLIGTVDKRMTFDYANKGYEEIKKLLLTENITVEDIKRIKLEIFEKIRFFDERNLDDSSLKYNSGEAISARITNDVLDNEELNNKKDIKETFEVLKTFSPEEKEALFKAVKGGKTSLQNFLYNHKVLSNLGLKIWEIGFVEIDKKKSFINDMRENIQENLDTLKESNTIEKELRQKIENEFDYLLTRIANKTEEDKSKRATILKNKEQILSKQNIEELVRIAKIEMCFKTLEKSVMNKVLENNDELVEKISERDKAVDLYRNIEGIGFTTISDKTSNKVSVSVQFLVEQLAFMTVSGGVGGLFLKGGLSLVRGVNTANIASKLPRIYKISSFVGRRSIEGTGFYLAYATLNGLITEKEFTDIFNNFNKLDLVKTIIALCLLRSLTLYKIKGKIDLNSKFFNETKNIVIDSVSVFGVYIAIRGTLGELLNKDGLPRDRDGNITVEDFLKSSVEDLSKIVILVIGLRQADKIINEMSNPKVTIIPKGEDVVIEFKTSDGKKAIRRLKQRRNTLRNKRAPKKKIKEINKEITKIKRRLKEEGIKKMQTNSQATKEAKKGKIVDSSRKANENASKAKENVSTEQGGNKEITGKIIQNVLKGNIEDVMKGFGRNGSISKEFQELLRSGNKEGVRKLVGKEVDLEVNRLQEEGVKIDEEGMKFVKEFKEQRIVEFERLAKIKREQKNIPSEIKMIFKGEEWDLKLKDLEGLNKWFEQWVKRNNLIQKDENNRIKNKKT